MICAAHGEWRSLWNDECPKCKNERMRAMVDNMPLARTPLIVDRQRHMDMQAAWPDLFYPGQRGQWDAPLAADEIPRSLLRANLDEDESSIAMRILGREIDGDNRKHDEREIRGIVNFDREPL